MRFPTPSPSDNRIVSLASGVPYTTYFFLCDSDAKGATNLGSVSNSSSGQRVDPGSYYDCHQQRAEQVIPRDLVTFTDTLSYHVQSSQKSSGTE